MLWLLIPLALVVVLFLLGHRKSAAGVLVAGIVAAGLVYGLGERVEHHETSRISASQVAFEGVRVRRTFDSSYEIAGTVRNSSDDYRIDGLTFHVTLRDCRGTDRASCTVMGEETTYVPVTVPPQQAREFLGTLYYGKELRQPKGKLEWDYKVTAITAKRQ